MRRFALLTALLLGTVVAVPASASAVTTSGNDTFTIKGVVVTTMTGQDQTGLLIEDSAVHPSTVSGLGRVSLHQRQLVIPAQTGPAFGTHDNYYGTLTSSPADASYLQAADGARLFFTFTTSFMAFDPAPRVIPDGVPWPIAFPAQGMADFVITFTGGTGRFAGASGTAHGAGSYCFMYNQGYYQFDGTVTLPDRT